MQKIKVEIPTDCVAVCLFSLRYVQKNTQHLRLNSGISAHIQHLPSVSASPRSTLRNFERLLQSAQKPRDIK